MKTAKQAMAYMRALSMKREPIEAGWCLMHCRTAWGLPGGPPDAIHSWENTPPQHRHTDWTKAPVGAPHFWHVGAHGHVALQAEHKGFIWSTDLPEVGHVGLVHLAMPSKLWHAVYLGWTDTLENFPIRLGPPAP